jgi:hypothetical protein
VLALLAPELLATDPNELEEEVADEELDDREDELALEEPVELVPPSGRGGSTAMKRLKWLTSAVSMVAPAKGYVRSGV